VAQALCFRLVNPFKIITHHGDLDSLFVANALMNADGINPDPKIPLS
jgi:hypothetical protein